MDGKLLVSGAIFLFAGPVLSGCAARPGPAQTATAITPDNSHVINGTVAAVRLTNIAGADGSRPGVNSVLAALGQAPVTTGITGQEIIVRRDDGTAVSVAGPQTGLAAEDRIVITETASGITVRRD